MARSGVDVDAWTSQTTESLGLLTLHSVGARGTGKPLAIDLNEEAKQRQQEAGARPRVHIRSEAWRAEDVRQRDSLRNREALLKGKEGSRRRLRWENDRLLNNPWAQPPSLSDWQIQPTHPARRVPYGLAPMWNDEMAERAEEARQRAQARRYADIDRPRRDVLPKDLREKLKKAKATKGLFRDLEEQIRAFAENIATESAHQTDRQTSERDAKEDEIVFVGRDGSMHDVAIESDMTLDAAAQEDSRQQQLVFDSLEADRGASFGRFLVHSIANYYGLQTWSHTTGDPARREAFVAAPSESAWRPPNELPQPLWGVV